MIRPARSCLHQSAVITRLAALTPLDDGATAALSAAVDGATILPARRELLTEGREVTRARLIVSGWAARVRVLADGRRQLLSFLLPGDLIGLCTQPRPLAVSTVVSLTEVSSCLAPDATASPALAKAYAISRATEEANLLAQITRLGRLNAQERIVDLLLEVFERLELAGLTNDRDFDLPLTQETFADMLGLTSVHINRMIQNLRREGQIVWKGGRMTIVSPEALAETAGRVPVRVSAA